MAVTHEDPGGEAAESVGGAGNEDAGHGIILPPMVCWRRSDAQAPASTSSHPARIPAAVRGAGPSGPAGLTRRPRRHRLAGGELPADRGLDPGAYLSRGIKIGAAGDAPGPVGQEHWPYRAGMGLALGE